MKFLNYCTEKKILGNTTKTFCYVVFLAVAKFWLLSKHYFVGLTKYCVADKKLFCWPKQGFVDPTKLFSSRVKIVYDCSRPAALSETCNRPAFDHLLLAGDASTFISNMTDAAVVLYARLKYIFVSRFYVMCLIQII